MSLDTILTHVCYAIVIYLVWHRKSPKLYRVCAWCNRIAHNNQFIKPGDWLDKNLNGNSTHGMCPECLNEELKKLKNNSNNQVQ